MSSSNTVILDELAMSFRSDMQWLHPTSASTFLNGTGTIDDLRLEVPRKVHASFNSTSAVLISRTPSEEARPCGERRCLQGRWGLKPLSGTLHGNA